MFFAVSKIFWMLFSPMTFITLLICGGGMARKVRAGRVALGTGITLLAIIGFLPVGQNLMVALENHHPEMTDFPKKVDGIIVLGGAVELKTSVARHQVQLNENAPRITEMLFLAKLYPDAKIIFTGGDGNLFKSTSNESIELYSLLKDIGFNPSKIIFEGESRNTYENMVFSKNLAHPKKGETWLLVTSAFHMPRSAAIFQSNGWDIIPYPAGYLTEGLYKFTPNLDVLGNMYKFQVAVREIVGIMAYTLTGRIHAYDSDDKNIPRGSAPAGGLSGGTGQ